MKQIGNLASICARRNNVLFQTLDRWITVHVGQGPDKKILSAAWNDDKKINEIIMELNFGKYSENAVIQNVG